MPSVTDTLVNQATSFATKTVTSKLGGLVGGVLGGGTNKPTAASTKSPALSDFLVDIQSRGVSHSSLFEVQFSVPLGITKVMQQWRPSFDPRILPVRCEMAELPGQQLMTSDNKTYGPTYKMPFQVMYNEMNLSFIVSSNMDERYFFDAWMGLIKTDSDNYGYYNDFVVPLTITQFDTAGNGVYRVRLINAFPTAVTPLTLNWQDSDVHKLSVTFAYERFEPIGMEPVIGKQDAQSGFGLGVFGNVLRAVLPTIKGYNSLITKPGVNNLLNGNFSLQTALQAGTAIVSSRNPSARNTLSQGGVAAGLGALTNSLPSNPIASPLRKLFGL